MIDEPCVVPLLALPNLVRCAIRLAHHDIHALQARSDESDEFANGPPLVERAAGHETVVLAVAGAEDLGGDSAGARGAVEVGVAFAAVEGAVVGLMFAAVRAFECRWVVVDAADGAWVVGVPGFVVDDRFGDVAVGEVAVPLVVGLCSVGGEKMVRGWDFTGSWDRYLQRYGFVVRSVHHPVVRMSVVLACRRLTDDAQ